MPKTKLRELLSELHDELESESGVDLEAQRLLLQVRDDIEILLELSSEAPIAHREQVRSGLGRALEALKTEHPGLFRVVGNMLDALTGLGI
ncbi:MAG: DUF4404 family protein [Deltaproteobacteria bacterium]|nr:DUF4404 family protein [Deltaproteobacteria bacterium]